MPNPKKYKNKKKWMQDCLHQTLHVEKKNKDQGVAECLNRWRQEKAIKIASLFLTKQSDIKKDLKKIKKSDKPSIFLGGVCKNDQWRNELKKEFPYFVFIDPYDPDWEPEDNIYDELTGLMKTDYIVFLKGGKGTKKEKNFLNQVKKEYKDFDSIDDLKKYLKGITKKLSANRIVKAFKYRDAHSFSSVQCLLPQDISKEIYTWGKENIPDHELSGNGRQPEDDIHVTLKYGLHGHDPFELRPYITAGPIEITLGNISIFENDDFDVVKLNVNAPKLHEYNKIVSDNFEHTDTHPDYIPHITVAYLKPGCGKKYQGRQDFSGKKLNLSSVEFSGNDNRKTFLPLI